MHSDLTQQERDEVMYEFKSGQKDVLVATDIVARGIDIDDISMVINYDVPHDAEDYVHRIGRTARADRDGVAITFVSDKDMYLFNAIEKFLEKSVEKLENPEDIGKGPEYSSNAKRMSLGRGNSSHGNGGRKHGDKGAKPRRNGEKPSKSGEKQQHDGGKPGANKGKRHGKQDSRRGNRNRNGNNNSTPKQ